MQPADPSGSRIAANVDTAIARLKQDVPVPPPPSLSEGTRAIEQAVTRALGLLPPTNGTAGGPDAQASSSTAPRLVITDAEARNLGALPLELWSNILHWLDEKSLYRAGSVCKGFYKMGLMQSPLDPTSHLARHQREVSGQHLQRIVDQFKAAEEYRRADRCRRIAAQFEAALRSYASRFRYIEVPVVGGLEPAMLDALKSTTNWQSLHIAFDVLTEPARLAELGMDLLEKKRQVSLDLNIKCLEAWPEDFPWKAFKLTHLTLADVQFKLLKDLPGLKNHLSGENALESLELMGDGKPDPVLPWLLSGSHGLKSLRLPAWTKDGNLLIEVLKTKPKLNELHLSYGAFEATQLNFIELLQALPRLQKLSFFCTHFKPGSTRGSTDVLALSCLREIEFEECLFIERYVEHKEDDLSVHHPDLLSGLSAAPRLECLRLRILLNLPASAPSLVDAFIRNPAARTVDIALPDDFWGTKDKGDALVEAQIRASVASRNQASTGAPINLNIVRPSQPVLTLQGEDSPSGSDDQEDDAMVNSDENISDYELPDDDQDDDTVMGEADEDTADSELPDQDDD